LCLLSTQVCGGQEGRAGNEAHCNAKMPKRCGQ
jgi:hypothetical protein